jgi:hypothetical protein
MKMGTTLSPWRYEPTRWDARKRKGPRRSRSTHYASFAYRFDSLDGRRRATASSTMTVVPKAFAGGSDEDQAEEHLEEWHREDADKHSPDDRADDRANPHRHRHGPNSIPSGQRTKASVTPKAARDRDKGNH